MNNVVFGKTMKILNCNNRKKKNLLGVRAKLLHHKVFHQKFPCNRNEKKIQELRISQFT